MLQPGTRLGPYEILASLGAGGMGEVYSAKDPRLDRIVAVKVLPQQLANDPAARARFEREVKAIAALSHPNILSIHDFGTDNGIAYAIMELLEGETLKARLLRGELSNHEILKIASEMADALAAAHSKEIIHRDLKPENIFLTSDNRTKLLDFGLARQSFVTASREVTSAPTQAALTDAGTVLGTVPYMSPEQLRGEPLDERTDIWSFGCVLYEMIHRSRPFAGTTSADVISTILTKEPEKTRSGNSSLVELDSILKNCLKKNPEHRTKSAEELAQTLHRLRNEQTQSTLRTQIKRQIRNPLVGIPIVLLFLAVLGGIFWFLARRAEVNRARNETIPEIMRSVEAEDFVAAFRLARKTESLVEKDPALEKLWPEMSRKITLHTIPEGAAIYWKEYRHPESEWELAGHSPLVEMRFPIGLLRWKIEKSGFQTIEQSNRARLFTSPTVVTTLSFTMDPVGTLPKGMVRVPGGEFSLELPGLDHLPPVLLDDYLVDETEVTNQEYQKFVDAGGYLKREYWKHKFLKDGRELTWEEAMAEFRDSTGRAGPAGWEVGNYPKGQEDYPVTGVSWYEAAAYAEFAGKNLPTIYHWNHAAGTWDSADVIPRSNFSGQGLNRVKEGSALNRYGTYDMAGNAKEWCLNESGDRRFILGGAWNEPTYMFNDPDAQRPFARTSSYGFRCVRYLKPVKAANVQSILWSTRDYRVEKPVSDEIFQVYKSMYTYDKTDLHAKVEFSNDTIANWRTEKITFDAAYGKERMAAYLFLPKNAKPPYQTILYFPGSGVIYQKSSDDIFKDARNMSRIGYIVESGRAMMYPIYKGTFERNDGLKSDLPAPTSAYRDHVIQWYKDLARSIDYLETRKDIDIRNLGFLGSSWGGAMGMILPAIETRLKANVLIVGGFYLQKAVPEVDQINFVSRIKNPTLMLNGRHDFFLPIETSQIPAFQLLGTPEKDKRQIFYETGHDIPRKEMIREVLDWLDRYLGPVSKS